MEKIYKGMPNAAEAIDNNFNEIINAEDITSKFTKEPGQNIEEYSVHKLPGNLLYVQIKATPKSGWNTLLRGDESVGNSILTALKFVPTAHYDAKKSFWAQFNSTRSVSYYCETGFSAPVVISGVVRLID